jgi:quinol monooxygenase YgiN
MKMTPGIVVLGALRFPPENLAEIRPHLKRLVDEAVRLDGCIAYDVAEDPFDIGLIRFSELWPNSDALANHLKAPHIEPWREAARENGLSERKFTAFEITGTFPV